MRDVRAKMRECGKQAKMWDFLHDFGTVDTYEQYVSGATIWHTTSHEMNDQLHHWCIDSKRSMNKRHTHTSLVKVHRDSISCSSPVLSSRRDQLRGNALLATIYITDVNGLCPTEKPCLAGDNYPDVGDMLIGDHLVLSRCHQASSPRAFGHR